jgi:cytochrome c-type biogenesis protein CcmH
MMFWFLASLLVGFAVLFTLWPLIRGADGGPAIIKAVAFYEARKAELERQCVAGEISPAERDAAMAEQGRALIALQRETAAHAGADASASVRRRKLAALAALVAVPVLALAVYMRLGQPAMPDRPLAAREAPAQTLDIASALSRIEAHLAKNPNDGRGFEVVAPVYLRAGRFVEAAHAYRRAYELLGETPVRLSDYGESLVAERNGVITADARKAFERALALDGTFAKARFYLALAREQDGDLPGALRDMEQITASLPPGPSKMRVDAEIERFRAEHKLGGTANPGPGTDTGKAIAALPQADRDAAIRAMVDTLDARLAASGGSVEEWRRLVQARLVLGERDKASAALAKAREAHGADEAAKPVFEALAAAIASPAP